MRKIFVLFLLLFSLFFNINNLYSDLEGTSGGNQGGITNCTFDGEGDIGDALDGCLQGTGLVSGNNVTVDGTGGFADKISNWVNNISIYLGIIAVGSIVYGSLILTLSAGEDEKITKAKNIIKWGILGFLGLISTAAIINLVVNIMYSL
ncbi:MAG: hypothetical protein Q8K30_00295 [Candidatus Gracilibacteria bacterium]|nr:hypothetical protein [Candidatus Gracilibacteria bacterium]